MCRQKSACAGWFMCIGSADSFKLHTLPCLPKVTAWKSFKLFMGKYKLKDSFPKKFKNCVPTAPLFSIIEVV